MFLDKLVEMIHRVPGGCTVKLTTINVPEHNRGKLYAIIEYGDRCKRVAHDEEELVRALARIGPPGSDRG
jgi:hypothetical protein